MKLLTLIALLSIAGCDELPYSETSKTDSRSVDNFMFTHNYGYCNDTACVGESIILETVGGAYEQCIYLYVTTGADTLHGLNHNSITLNYNLMNSYNVSFGNGQTQIFNNNGTFDINWKCNRTYEVIICYE